MREEGVLNAAKNGSIMHAFLISGEGSEVFAERLCAAYVLKDDSTDTVRRLKQSPNYMELGKTDFCGVGDIRTLVENTAVQSFNHENRAYLVFQADRMTEQAQNALLKTLEEPPENTVIVLCGREAGLLPTIRSRCTVLRLGAQNTQEIAQKLNAEGMEPKKAQMIAAWSGGSMRRAEQMKEGSYVEFRQQAGRILEEGLFSNTPFLKAQKLLKDAEVFSEETKEKDEDGKSKKNQKTNALQILAVWRDLLRDALLTAENCTNLLCPEEEKFSCRIAETFTRKRILGMISKIAEAEKAILQNASPALQLDAVLLRCTEKEE